MSYSCYSKFGLEDLIRINKERIQNLTREKSDMGKDWTEKHVECHIKTIDKEIEDIVIETEEIQKELNSRTQ